MSKSFRNIRMQEAKDPGEYDQEGDMSMTQLRSIIYHAQELHDQLDKNDNLPEWVQSKITLAQDYVQTACDYMYSQKNEEVVQEKRGLWLNIHDKRKRIKNGSGESMRKPGSEGAPSAEDLKNSQVKEEVKGEYERKVDTYLKKKYGKDKSQKKLPQGSDFAAARRKERLALNGRMDEDVEQIDELSKDTLYSYVRKSEKNQDDQFDKIGKGIRDNDPKSANKAGHKFSMRSFGQNRAEKRLAKEEVEQIDEIHAPGTKVKVSHMGKMVSGKVIRHDKGEKHGSPFYVVDVGTYESPKVPAHKVQKEEVDQMDEAGIAIFTKKYKLQRDERKKKEKDKKELDRKITNGTAHIQQKYKEKGVAEEVEQMDEGRPSQQHPIEGHEYHKKSDAELRYILKDAGTAAKAMKDHSPRAESKYLDQVNDASTVLSFRQRNGTPAWYKKKYDHVKEEVVTEGYFSDMDADNKDKQYAGTKAYHANKNAKKEMDPPFTPDAPKKNLGIVVGKRPEGMSKARHLARLAMKGELNKKKTVKEDNTPDVEKTNTPAKRTVSKTTMIVKDAAKSSKDKKNKDKFEAEPELSSQIVRNNF